MIFLCVFSLYIWFYSCIFETFLNTKFMSFSCEDVEKEEKMREK